MLCGRVQAVGFTPKVRATLITHARCSCFFLLSALAAVQFSRATSLPAKEGDQTNVAGWKSGAENSLETRTYEPHGVVERDVAQGVVPFNSSYPAEEGGIAISLATEQFPGSPFGLSALGNPTDGKEDLSETLAGEARSLRFWAEDVSAVGAT